MVVVKGNVKFGDVPVKLSVRILPSFLDHVSERRQYRWLNLSF